VFSRGKRGKNKRTLQVTGATGGTEQEKICAHPRRERIQGIYTRKGGDKACKKHNGGGGCKMRPN